LPAAMKITDMLNNRNRRGEPVAMYAGSSNHQHQKRAAYGEQAMLVGVGG